MKGLMEYIEKNGRHFTVKLASDIIGGKLDSDKVSKATESKVYYNVIEATLGDIIYLANLTKKSSGKNRNVSKCVEDALKVVGDYRFCDGKLFVEWLCGLLLSGKEFDFSDYI